MSKGRLVVGSEAKPAKKQHTKPCSDCPWARKALAGWLGSFTPETWIALAHGEGHADCHTVIDKECAGLATYRANVCKSLRDPNAFRLPADRVLVFSNSQEFLDHHNNGSGLLRKGNV